MLHPVMSSILYIDIQYAHLLQRVDFHLAVETLYAFFENAVNRWCVTAQNVKTLDLAYAFSAQRSNFIHNSSGMSRILNWLKLVDDEMVEHLYGIDFLSEL